MSWMKQVGVSTWEWDWKYPTSDEAVRKAVTLTKQFKVPVLSRQIEDEVLYECYTEEPLDVPRSEHSNLCRCRECFTPPR